MSIFFSSAADAAQAVLDKISPNSSNNDRFNIGSGKKDAMTAAQCLSIVEVQEDKLFSYLPNHYRHLMRYVDGEVLTNYAEAGQTVLPACSLLPLVEDTAKLYIDYPKTKSWLLRNYKNEASENGYTWTIDNTTGVVTITSSGGLLEGSRVWIEYQHSKALTGFPILRDAVVTWSVVEISRRYRHFNREDSSREVFTEWEVDKNIFFNELRKQGRLIDEIESIDLVTQDTNDGKQQGYFSRWLNY